MTTYQVINPATEQPITTVELADEAATDSAIERAHAAFQSWRTLAPGARATLLRAFADNVAQHIDELAALEVANAGHTITNATWEAGNVRDVIEYFAAVPERLFGKQIPVLGGIDITFEEPLGVVGVIVPWNFPMPIAAWGFAPALAAGNTVVLKPAEVTPLTAIRLGELALEAGIPEGVFTVIPGKGSVVGERFVTHPLVRKIVFTGSTEVGKKIIAGCAAHVKNLTLELGGKNANIVFGDADIQAAATSAPGGVFDNAGQDCCSRSRLLVQDTIYDEFLSALKESVAGFTCMDPTDRRANMGPLVTASHRDTVAGYVAEAAVAFRGTCPSGPGFWFPPTVIEVDDVRARNFNEEIFGPVLSVAKFHTEDQAVEIANNTEYGLSGSIWTQNLDRAIRVARAVEAGNLSVNSHSSVRYWTPFGGYKQSGLGRELGPDAVKAFTETKNVFIAVSDAN